MSSTSGCAPSWATPRSPERPTYGPAVAKLSAFLGRPLMPWQKLVADVALEVLPTGRWAYRTVVVTVPRQSGKSSLVSAVIAHRGQLVENGSLWMTAQDRGKAKKRWDGLTRELERKLPRTFKRKISNAHEVLQWLETGSQLFLFSPDGSSMHGESPDLVAPDEIWHFNAAQSAALQQAYLPGMITKNAQEWLTSTQGTDESEWLNDLTATGRSAVDEGRREGIAYFEWSIPPAVDGTPVEKLDNERLLDVIAAHHPAYGDEPGPGVTTREGLAFYLDRFAGDRAGYIRGYGNLRMGSTHVRVIPESVWSAAETDWLIPERVGIGVAVDEDGQNVAVVAAGRLPSGQAVVEVVQTGPGWTLQLDDAEVAPSDFVKRIRSKSKVVGVATMTTGANRDLGDQLGSTPIGPADYAAACARFRNGVRERTVLHRDQPSLNDAMKTVGQRKAAGGLGWSGVGATVADAASLALWAADHPGEVVGRFQVF